ncbi:MAG: hypothetical protein DWQ37_22120 [Planctomycetota bacterium]|nr:MAG: hypothetical protein DWQ37_22120 [Planctomycetota bacterium]
MTNQELEVAATKYAELCKITLNLKTPLGKGQDGCVWKSSRKTAVKAFERPFSYDTELECYQRFKDNRVIRIQGFSVPQLFGFSDDLLIIEMSIVAPPYILDFAKAWLDNPPDFSAEALADHAEKSRELFGERWRDVASLAWALREFGIYYYDTNPGNIRFGDD